MVVSLLSGRGCTHFAIPISPDIVVGCGCGGVGYRDGDGEEEDGMERGGSSEEGGDVQAGRQANSTRADSFSFFQVPRQAHSKRH